MKKLCSFVFLCSAILASAIQVSARSGDDSAAACGAMGCGIVVWLVMMAVSLAIGITVIVLIYKYIKKDATARGMPNANNICWLALLGLIGLVIYLLTRPQGNVLPCPRCDQPRMQGLPVCPHCHQP